LLNHKWSREKADSATIEISASAKFSLPPPKSTLKNHFDIDSPDRNAAVFRFTIYSESSEIRFVEQK
jgi:hypothetical protein